MIQDSACSNLRAWIKDAILAALSGTWTEISGSAGDTRYKFRVTPEKQIAHLVVAKQLAQFHDPEEWNEGDERQDRK